MIANGAVRCWVAFVGRLLLAAIFIIAGYGKLTHFSATAEMMVGKGLPMANVLLVLTIIIELGGGLLLATGWYARQAALAIFLFIIPVTYVFHPFWSDPGQQIMFLKNLAIMGGMAQVVAYGPSCGVGCKRA
ncbi:MAG TPA: DoxX family protein [Gammaproteobacteria bacterium]|nr:DoxX family protein [Gammaproteobacteria bacterium]